MGRNFYSQEYKGGVRLDHQFSLHCLLQSKPLEVFKACVRDGSNTGEKLWDHASQQKVREGEGPDPANRLQAGKRQLISGAFRKTRKEIIDDQCFMYTKKQLVTPIVENTTVDFFFFFLRREDVLEVGSGWGQRFGGQT